VSFGYAADALVDEVEVEKEGIAVNKLGKWVTTSCSSSCSLISNDLLLYLKIN